MANVDANRLIQFSWRSSAMFVCHVGQFFQWRKASNLTLGISTSGLPFPEPSLPPQNPLLFSITRRCPSSQTGQAYESTESDAGRARHASQGQTWDDGRTGNRVCKGHSRLLPTNLPRIFQQLNEEGCWLNPQRSLRFGYASDGTPVED